MVIHHKEECRFSQGKAVLNPTGKNIKQQHRLAHQPLPVRPRAELGFTEERGWISLVARLVLGKNRCFHSTYTTKTAYGRATEEVFWAFVSDVC